METISTFDLRNKLGRVIDGVRYTRKPVVVLKKNKPVVLISPIEETSQGIFNLGEYRKLVKTLPKKYQVGDPSPKLLKIIGSGPYIPFEKEKEAIHEYLDEKYGSKSIA